MWLRYGCKLKIFLYIHSFYIYSSWKKARRLYKTAQYLIWFFPFCYGPHFLQHLLFFRESERIYRCTEEGVSRKERRWSGNPYRGLALENQRGREHKEYIERIRTEQGEQRRKTKREQKKRQGNKKWSSRKCLYQTSLDSMLALKKFKGIAVNLVNNMRSETGDPVLPSGCPGKSQVADELQYPRLRGGVCDPI